MDSEPEKDKRKAGCGRLAGTGVMRFLRVHAGFPPGNFFAGAGERNSQANGFVAGDGV
jgi:hypothetical protein